jgi:phosphatidylglycerol:prolipoprotein diacylglycerol transferase
MYPILFEFGIITVFSLWFFIAVGFVFASLIFIRLSKRYRMRLTMLSEHSLVLFLWTLLLSRLTFIVLHIELYFYRFQFKNFLKLFAIWDKGLSFWGAAFAWFSGLWFFSRRQQTSSPGSPFIARLWDITFPALLIGMFFGNIGAFLDGINYGTPTNLPWGMTFRNANVKYISAIHPTQLYSAIYVILLAGGLLTFLEKLRGRLPGFVAEFGIFCFGVLKFLEEFLRGDETLKIFSVRFPQLLALIAVIGSGYFLLQRYHNRTGGDPEYLIKNTVARFLKKWRKSDPSAMTAIPRHPLQNQTR